MYNILLRSPTAPLAHCPARPLPRCPKSHVTWLDQPKPGELDLRQKAGGGAPLLKRNPIEKRKPKPTGADIMEMLDNKWQTATSRREGWSSMRDALVQQ